MDTQTARLSVQRSNDRAGFDFGWLRTRHSFSFGSYRDPTNTNWGALRVFNDDVVRPGEGFGTHPHRDMEILTYVLDGELAHRDSMGNERVVGPGAVQYLSAGTGIAHSEYNASATHPVHFVQMWVVPRATGLAPRYGQVDFTLDDRRDAWLTIASGSPGVDAPIAIWQDATAYVAHLGGATTLTKTIAPGRRAFLFVASGDVTLGETSLGSGDAPPDGTALASGDAVRIVGPFDLSIAGRGEVVLWDVPSLEASA